MPYYYVYDALDVDLQGAKETVDIKLYIDDCAIAVDFIF